MAIRVPDGNNGDIGQLSDGSVGRFDTSVPSAAGTAPGDQMQKLGSAVEGFGKAEADIDVDTQNLANQVRVSDAMNQARQKALDLTYNPDTGYANLKGGQALNRPDGQALPDEYGQKLGSSLSDINASLSNDAQRRAFQMQAGDLATSFTGDVEKHMLGEFRDYHMSVAKGQGELATQDAQLNWSNPQKIDQALNGVPDPTDPDNPNARTGGLKESIYQQALISGMSANQATAEMNAAESKIHSTVIDSALVNNNPTYAQAYFQANKSSMTGNDILQVQGKLNHQVDAQTSLLATTASTAKYKTAFAPTDMDRLHGVVQGLESSGKETDANGNVLTSLKGAQGSMQVMPTTATDPGYGVTPAHLTGDPVNDAAERKRVGQDYIDTMLKRYGNVPQALAAYNAGPGTVDDALAKAKTSGQPWASFLPKETQDYVDTGSKQFQAGAGTPALPTKEDFVNDAINRLGDTPRIEQVQMTREQAEKQYDLMQTSRKEQGDQALKAAQQELIANKGNFAALQPETVSNLSRYDAGKYDDALKFAKAISKGENNTNMEAYITAVSHPEELAQMSDTQFTQFATTNLSTSDGERVARLRANILNGKDDESAQSINNKAVNTELNNRLLSIGINPNPPNKQLKDREQIGTIQKYVRDSIYDQQGQLGRKMSPEEINGHIDNLFTKDVQLPGVLWGTNNKNMMSMKIGDVPGAAVQNIRNVYKSRGINNPSDSDIMESYWNWKNKNG